MPTKGYFTAHSTDQTDNTNRNCNPEIEPVNEEQEPYDPGKHCFK